MKTKYTHSSLNSRGLTVIETLFAIFVAAVTLGAFLSTVRLGMNITTTSNNVTIATCIAQGLIEERLNANFNTLETGYTDSTTARRNVNYNGDTTTYDCSIDVDTTPSPLGPTMKQITVSVYWVGLNGEKSVQLSTLRYIYF